MKLINDFLIYETPQVEIIEVEVEKGFANSPDNNNTENPKEGEESGW